MSKLMALLGIRPLIWKVLNDARGFIAKMEHLRNQEATHDDMERGKLKAHATRTLWLLRRGEAPSTLRAVLKDGLLEADIRRCFLIEWNR